MSKVNSKYIKFGTATNDVNSSVIPTNYTPSNFTPTDTFIKGSIQGLDNKVADVFTTGDIPHTSFSLSQSVGSPTAVTGLAFANGSVRSFKALVSVYINATTSLYETYELQGVQKSSSWVMVYSSIGDSSGVAFTINSSGQILYTSGTYSGFSAGTIKFRAQVTAV